MKRTLLFIGSLMLFAIATSAQSPEAFKYQAVARDAGGQILANQSVSFQISILQSSASGTSVYSETHAATTNTFGLVNLEIGNGVVVSGNFSNIDWGTDSYFVQIEMDESGGSNYQMLGTSQLLSVPYAMHAKTAGNVSSYSVGDFAHGGIVFWVDETGQHGLACTKSDQSTNVRWYAGTHGNTQAKGSGPYAGAANTAIIIAAQVAIGDDGNTYAARICNELQITEGGKTYGDWYLPSKGELNLMYENKAAIDTTAIANGGVGFAASYYWSSTEFEEDFYAGAKNFFFGDSGYFSKDNVFRVRAVRAF
jgi:hypothetical protein